MAQFICVGVGPGNQEHLTLGVKDAIEKAEVLTIPVTRAGEKGFVYTSILPWIHDQEILELYFPMEPELEARIQRREAAAAAVMQLLVYANLPTREALGPAPEDAFPLRRFGLPDKAFLRGERPMTKQATRLLALGLLDLPPEGVFWDIGAGTGSVALEVARAFPKQNVFGIEKEAEGIRLINENKARFAIKNLEAVHGRAGEVLSDLPFCHRAFIGGSAGEMERIFELLEQGFLREVEKQNLLHDPLWIAADRCLKLCVSAVTLTTPVRAMEAAKRHGFCLQQSLLLNVAQGQKVGPYVLDRAENPVRLLFFERRES